MIAETNISRPALRYYGGKWKLAPWIISHFPPHKNYVEPCGGAGSVLLQKSRSPLETYNDIDGNVVNFFRVLRDQPEELLSKIRLTPWAREEYETSLDTTDDLIEQARRFWVWCWMGIGGKWGGWRTITDTSSRNGGEWPSDHISIDHLLAVSDRFQSVQIEHLDAFILIQKYDNPNALIYLDPPYVSDERERPGRYEYEWTVDQHRDAAELLRECKGAVIVSGYACPLYTELYQYHGWTRVDRVADTNAGGKRVESLWLNRKCISAQQQPSLFASLSDDPIGRDKI
jgi:DNA adenine methylase